MRKLFTTMFAIVRVVIALVIQNLIYGIQFIHSKKRYALPFYAFVCYFLFVVVLIGISGESTFEKVLGDKRVNDVTQLNPIHISKEIQPVSIQEIVQAIKSTTGPISIGGGRFSMGGQIGYENSLHFDMRTFNKVLSLNTEKKQVTVQSGITWRDLQKVIDRENLSVKIMQTYANFTVGGSVSVNCHGRYIGHGPIISSVINLKIVTASGEVLNANRRENRDVFNAAIGGYGGIGLIAEVTLQLVDNEKVERQSRLVDLADYNDFFQSTIRNDSNVIFQNGDLYPPDYDVINNVAWIRTDKELTDTTRVTPEDIDYWLEPRLVEVASWGAFGKWIRKSIFDPFYYSQEKVVWRNKEASYDVSELEPRSRKKHTYVLQEYFIPVRNLASFVPKMKAIYEKYDVNVINVSLRHAYPDNESFLSWATEEVFALVIYYKQGTDAYSRSVVKQWTVEMTDAILSENGKWYLPYQPHATTKQFKEGFVRSEEFFDMKSRMDPSHRFTNKLLDKYNPFLTNSIEKERERISGYFRREEQTVLTVPEWYLVFNPKEYSDYLEANKNPSDFPYYSSIDEYWKLYDRSLKLVSEAYPSNEEYITMLKVIGVSMTMEYAGKIIYERSIGRFFSWFAEENVSEKEKTIYAAHRAYSDFIYEKAWYEFEFLPWIGKVWSTKGSENASWLREWERTLFFTCEFILKAGYAQLIEWGAAGYDEPTKDIFMLVSNFQGGSNYNDVKVINEQDSLKIISIPRWGTFTRVFAGLSTEDIEIQGISGNDEIVISILANPASPFTYKYANVLYCSAVVTDDRLQRFVCMVPVNKLLPFIRFAKQNNVTVEHIFDY